MILHYIGSGCVLFMICYIVVDLFEKKKVTVVDVASRAVIVALLFIALLRT